MRTINMMLSGKQIGAFARRHCAADIAADGKARFPWLFGSTLAAGLMLACATADAGYVEGMDAFSRGDYIAAHDELRPVAEGGDPNAQFTLGFMYDYGQGVRQSTLEAIWWYRKAAEQGLAVAQFTLGSIFEAGRGTRKDPVEAYRWYSLAANNLPAGEIRDTVSERRNLIGASLSPAELDEAQALLAGEASLPPTDTITTATEQVQTTHDVDRRLLIAEIQAELTRLGYDVGPGSGDLDDKTRGAIKAFQIEHGLEMTGQPSTPLLQALRDAEGLVPVAAPAGLPESADEDSLDNAAESPPQLESTTDPVNEAAASDAPEAKRDSEDSGEPAAPAETAADAPAPVEEGPVEPAVAVDPVPEEAIPDPVLATEPRAGPAETVVEELAAPAETDATAEMPTVAAEAKAAEPADTAETQDTSGLDDEAEAAASEDLPAQDIVVADVTEAPSSELLETTANADGAAAANSEEAAPTADPAPTEHQLAAVDNESQSAPDAEEAAQPETAAPSGPPPALVRDVQEELVRLGYRIGLVDGVAGRRTTGAIGDFQASRGLTVTGQISEELLTSLAAAEPAVLPPPDEPDPATLARRETIDQQLGSLREIARNVDSPTAALPGWGQLEAWESRTAELLRTRFGPQAAEGLAERRKDIVLGDPYGNFQRTAEAYRIYLAQLRQSLE